MGILSKINQEIGPSGGPGYHESNREAEKRRNQQLLITSHVLGQHQQPGLLLNSLTGLSCVLTGTCPL